MTKQYVTADELKKAADYLASTKEQGGCYHWKICANTDDNKDIYIVLGWTQYEYDSGNTKYYDKGYNLAVKVAYQPSNSIMQCDYDVDFNLPYNPYNGEIDNDFEYLLTDTTDFNSIARDLNSNASWLIKHWKELGHD